MEFALPLIGFIVCFWGLSVVIAAISQHIIARTLVVFFLFTSACGTLILAITGLAEVTTIDASESSPTTGLLSFVILVGAYIVQKRLLTRTLSTVATRSRSGAGASSSEDPDPPEPDPTAQTYSRGPWRAESQENNLNTSDETATPHEDSEQSPVPDLGDPRDSATVCPPPDEPHPFVQRLNQRLPDITIGNWELNVGIRSGD